MNTFQDKYLKSAREVFSLYPEADKVIVTSDNNCFFPADQGLAKDHCRYHGATMIEIEREDALRAETDPTDPLVDMPDEAEPIDQVVEVPGETKSEASIQEPQQKKTTKTGNPKKQS